MSDPPWLNMELGSLGVLPFLTLRPSQRREIGAKVDGPPVPLETPSPPQRNQLLSSGKHASVLGPRQREKVAAAELQAECLRLLFYLPAPVSCLLFLVAAGGRRPEVFSHVASESPVTLLPLGGLVVRCLGDPLFYS